MGKQYDKNNDRELVLLTLKGEEAAFSHLIDRHKSQLLNYIQSFTSVTQDAEDILQESFRKAFTSLNSYDSKYEFSTWLYTIAANTAKDHLRRVSSISSITMNENSQESYIEPSDTISSPEDQLISDQTYETLIEMISNLDPLYKEVATLRFLDQYAYQEIAKELNLELGTVKTRLRRARVQLTEKIKEKL